MTRVVGYLSQADSSHRMVNGQQGHLQVLYDVRFIGAQTDWARSGAQWRDRDNTRQDSEQ